MGVNDGQGMCYEMSIERKSTKTLGDTRKMKARVIMKMKSGFASETRNVKRVVGLLVCDASMRGTLVRWFIGAVMK